MLVMEARPMWAATEAALRADPLCLAEEIEAGAEDRRRRHHALRRGAGAVNTA
jgi:hypothetical protein